MGRVGYISKYCDNNPLIKAIETVMDNKIFLCPLSTHEVANRYIKNDDTGKAKLNRQEKKIIRMLAQGHFNEEVANKLGISRRTVETHRKNIMKKIGTRNLADITRYAMKHGLVKV